MAKNKLNLMADFPPVSTKEWMDKITADLKGADFDKKLVWKTNEGFNVRPFYRSEDIDNLKITDLEPGEFPYVRGTKTDNNWLIRQDIVVSSAMNANVKALDMIARGANSINFTFNREDLSPGFIAVMLQDIDAEKIELNFRACIKVGAQLLRILTDYFKQNEYDLKKLHGSIAFDPIKGMFLKGKNFVKDNYSGMMKEAVEAGTELPFYRIIAVTASILHNTGASITQELGYALAWGNEYLSMLTDMGMDAALVAKKTKFDFGVGSNYFMEIAKFRAARMLWAIIVDQYAPKCPRKDCPNTVDGICKCAAKMKIHAETASYNMTIYDPNVNMLRTQTEAMSAAIAGVDSLTVFPYDFPFKIANDFSERIARNQQLLLKEESHFDKVTDPSAGSYYIETLTAEVAKQAWQIFLEVEEKGGFFNLVKSGEVQRSVKQTDEQKLKSIASRREVLLGTNQYPNFNEFMADKVEEGAGECNCGCSDDVVDGNTVELLVHTRAAREFEALRFATEESGKRPKVFMLTIGNLAMRLARAQFSSNFFACAGYEVIDNLGFDTVEAGLKAAEAAKADVVVLCSSDDEYETLALDAYNKAKDKFSFVVAGAPASMEEMKAQGVKFINVRSNVLETLKEFNRELGI